MAGYRPNSIVVTTDFITIGTLGNAQDFGDVTQARGYHAGVSNSIRAVSAGGGINVRDGSSFVSIGDSVAALFGIKYPIGRIWDKSFSGTLMGTLTCIIIVLAINQTLSPIIIILGAISAMAIELLPLKINDNFSIPIFSGIIMHVLSKII